MGKLSALADRIKDTKTRLEQEADKLALKLDGIDATAPKAFDRGHAFLDAQKAEVEEIESTLRQLSNLPLDGSESSPGASKPGTAPNGAGKPVGESKLPQAPQLPPGGAAAQTPFPDDAPGR